MKAVTAVLVSVALLVVLPGVSWPDAIEDQIRQALDLYGRGNLSGALQTLQVASSQLEKQKMDQLLGLFPNPLPGWTANAAAGEYFPYAIMGGGIMASRTYQQKPPGPTVQIEIITNESLVQGVLMLLDNPFLASQQGVKTVQINGYPAVVEFTAQDRAGKVSVVIKGKMLVELEGDGLDDNQVLMEYAQKTDFPALDQYLSR